MKHKTTLTLVALLLVFAVAYAASGRPRQDKPYASAPGLGMNARISDLSVEEQDKLYRAKLDHEKEVIPLRAEIRVLNMEIEEMIRDGKSGKELEARVDKLNELRASLNKQRIAHRLDVRESIGEERYQQLSMYHYADGRGGMRRDGPRFEGKSRSTRNYRNIDRDCPYGYETPRNAGNRRR